MKAMVLAAGLGTRLRPLTERVPKPLVEVDGRPLIEYSLRQLGAAGIRDVVINVHHMADRVIEGIGDGSRYGLRLTYSIEEELLETGGGIENARQHLGDGTFLLLNADTIHDVPLRELITFHRSRGGIGTLVLRPDARARRYGIIEIDALQRVRRFLGVPRRVLEKLDAFMFAGVSIFEADLFRFMPSGRYSLTQATIPRLLKAGETLYGYSYDGFWRVVDRPEDLEAARSDVGKAQLSYLRS